MLKSELMDLLHGLDEDAEVYIEIYAGSLPKVRSVHVDEDGDIILGA